MGLREEKKEQLRADILDAAEDLFRTYGFEDTRVEDLMEVVGISRQTFFNYFPSKEAVLRELGMQWLDAVAERARRSLDRGRRGSALAYLRSLFLAQLRSIKKDREFMHLVYTRSGLYFPQFKDSLQGDDEQAVEQAHELLEPIIELFEDAKRRKELRVGVEPAQAAEMLAAVQWSVIRNWLTSFWGKRTNLETRALRAHDLLMDGLKARRR